MTFGHRSLLHCLFRKNFLANRTWVLLGIPVFCKQEYIRKNISNLIYVYELHMQFIECYFSIMLNIPCTFVQWKHKCFHEKFGKEKFRLFCRCMVFHCYSCTNFSLTNHGMSSWSQSPKKKNKKHTSQKLFRKSTIIYNLLLLC